MDTDEPPVGNQRTRRQPQRWLAPHLAHAVRDAKEATGLSWREIGRRTGVSHSHLVLISNGRRVPSDAVVEALAEVLPITDGELEGLRRVAVRKQRFPH